MYLPLKLICLLPSPGPISPLIRFFVSDPAVLSAVIPAKNTRPGLPAPAYSSSPQLRPSNFREAAYKPPGARLGFPTQ